MNVGMGKAGAAGMINALGLKKELSKVMAAAEAGTALEVTLKNATKAIEQALGASGGGAAAGAVTPFPPDAIEKLMYLSVLRGAMRKITESKHFNLETQINDLWVKLSLLRQQKSGDSVQKLQQAIEKQSHLQQAVAAILKAHHDTIKNTIQNIR